MALQLVWALPDRELAEETLYITLRMMHIRGWRHLLFAVPPKGRVFVGVELSPETSEENARDWSQLFATTYRVETTLEALLADPWRWSEIYIDAGLAPLMNNVERRNADAERARQNVRRGRSPRE